MTQTDVPDLSVVVVTRDSFRTLLPIVKSLASQTVADRLELIVVAPDASAGVVPASESASFHSSKILFVGRISNRGRAAAAGVAEASAPIVALTENHCFPVADWAARLLDAHNGGLVALGPAIVNANPESAISRVMHTAGYGSFPAGGHLEARDELPLHNSSYRTDVLQSFADRLPDLLADERRLQSELRRMGYTLTFDPSIRKRHISEATLGLLLGMAYDGGRRYGGGRAREWSLPRRLTYALLSPTLTIPIAAKLSRRMAGESLMGSVGLVSWLWAFIHAMGEGVSYVSGERHVFPFTESEEFLILERLGRRGVTDPEIDSWLQLLNP